ncbi:hypothetical protein [Candidatus Enterovibrio escicola]|uniref:hypothetical protein n=1 Tax=Candidatus Enterovibrio escicola TaxID=1927127 RepID=UPI001CC22D54|nr:hypothetical protein [Candidatus Enterovibrio escacola]
MRKFLGERTGGGIKYNSILVTPYIKQTQNIEALIPWLCLRGISTGGVSHP